MKTEAKLKEAMKNIMAMKPIEEINVALLCKKCNIHRQTFYYHYQNIYDLLSAILLNETIVGLKEANSVSGVMDSFIGYTSKNLKFIQATYHSSARELVEELYFGRIYNRLFSIFTISYKDMTKADCRTIARRFSKHLSEEFSHCFADTEMTASRMEKQMKRFGSAATEIVLPAMIESYKKEKIKK